MTWTPSHILLHAVAFLTYPVCVYHAWIFLIPPLRSKCTRTTWNTSFKGVCRKVFRFICCSRHPATSPLGRAIQEQMNEFRLAQCGKIACVTSHCYAPLLVMVLIYAQIGAAYTPPDFLEVLTFLGYSCMYLIALLVAAGHIQLTERKVDGLAIVLNLISIAAVGSMTDNHNFLLHHSGRLFIRIALGIAHLDFTKSIFWNIAFSTVTCWRYPYNASVVHTGEETMLRFTIRELFLCMGVNWGCYVVQTWLEARFQVQIIANNQKRATLKLAAYQCDAVCWLSPDLRLSAPAPHFAHMLFVEDANNHLKGRKFENYIATASDQERFHEFLGHSVAASEPEGLPALFHMDLRDANDQAFQVEVFHSCYVDDEDQIGHVLGISESRCGINTRQEQREPGEQNIVHEQQEAHRPGEVDPADSMAPTLVGRLHTDAELAGGRRPGVPNAADASSSDRTQLLVPLLSEDQEFAPVCVMFDGCTYQVVGCTVGFMTFVGPVVYKTHLREYLLNFREFVQWMQERVNEFVGEGQATGNAFDIRIAQPTSRKDRKFEFRAKAYLVNVDFEVRATDMGVQPGEDFDDPVHEGICLIELRGTAVYWLEEERRNKRRRANDATSSTVALHVL